MTHELDAYAAAIADPIDRIRIAISQGTRERLMPLVGELGIGLAGAQVLGMLRGLGPERRVTRANIVAAHVYQPDHVDPGIEELEHAGLIDHTTTIGLTEAGVHAITRMLATSGEVVDAMWAAATVDFDELLAIAARVLETALHNAGPALALVGPIYIPAGTPARHVFAETLTPLRFIRFDAHVEAWQGEGLTVAEIQSLNDTALRDRIEARTNELAGAPFTVITGAQRTTFRDSLHALAPSA